MTKGEYITKYGEKDGLRRWKRNEYTKRWRQENREQSLESVKRWRQGHREEQLEYYKQRYQEHREEILERKKQYRQAHREEQLKYNKQYRQEHREKIKQYNQEHREEILERKKQYRQTPFGRASLLVRNYRQYDLKNNRGECTITQQWVVDNIFTKRCLYCGESDWRKLGTDRIDNSKPHTPGNVVCCCGKCNNKRRTKDFLEFAYSMGAKDSEGLTIKY